MATHTRRPGSGPRQADTLYRSVLETVIEHGFDALTIEGVAARTGVNKTTIYRWWPSKDALLADSLVHSQLLQLRIPDTGELRGDLVLLVARVRHLFTAEATAPLAISLFTAAQSRPALAELTREFFADRLAREREIFLRGVVRGELAVIPDVATVIDLLLGAIWSRVVLRRTEIPSDFDERVVDLLLPGIATAADPPD